MSINAETVINCKLLELEPSLDIRGIETMVYRMCHIDFHSFIIYFKEVNQNLCNRDNIIVPITIAGENLAEVLDNFINMCIGFELDDIEDDRKAIEAWTEWWFMKYKKRVKISFNDNFPVNNSPTDNRIISKFTAEEMQELKKIIKNKFIEQGEICGSTTLTDALINKIMSQYSDKITWDVTAKLNLMNTLVREANRMVKCSGVLIWIKPSKQSYGLREFREDGTMPTGKQ